MGQGFTGASKCPDGAKVTCLWLAVSFGCSSKSIHYVPCWTVYSLRNKDPEAFAIGVNHLLTERMKEGQAASWLQHGLKVNGTTYWKLQQAASDVAKAETTFAG